MKRHSLGFILAFAPAFLLYGTACFAQFSISHEYGTGFNIASTHMPEHSLRQASFYSKTNNASGVTLLTHKNRFYNLGLELTFSRRTYRLEYIEPGYYYESNYANNCLYLTPTADFSFDRHRHLHFQALAAVGIITRSEIHDGLYEVDGKTGVRSPILSEAIFYMSRMNVRVGCSVYGQYPLASNLNALIKAEYTASINKITTFYGTTVRPSDLLFKIGLSYTVNR